MLSACGSPAATPPAGSSARSSSAAASLAALNPPVKLKVAGPVTIPAAPVYIALDRGYFKDQGLEVDLVPTQGSSETAQLLATGQVAFGITGPDPATFNAMERGIDARIVASAAVNSPTERTAAVLVRADLLDSGSYKSPKDLKGKTIGIPSQMAQLFIERFLNGDGLTTSDVKLVNLGLPDILPALKNKAIDAAWEIEPLLTAAEKQGLAKPVATTGQLFPGAIPQALLMTTAFGKDQPEAARRFVLAYLHGLRDYYHAFNKKDGDPGPVTQALVNHTAVKDASLYELIGMPTVDANGAMDRKSWDEFQDYFIKVGVQKQKIDLARYIDMSYVDAALTRLGREP